MNGIEKITARILADTEREAAEIRVKAEADCAEIAAQYETEAQDAYWQVVTAGKRAADLRAERLSGTAAMEAKKQLLAFKQEMVGKAFDEALARLVRLPEGEYVALLASLAARSARTGGEQLIFSAEDRVKVGARVTAAANEKLKAAGKPGNLTLSEETRRMAGGLIITDGLVDVNCSFEAMVDAQKMERTGEIAQILFE